MDSAVSRARRDLAAAFRLAVRFGFQEGICNHFSCLVPGRQDRLLINPQGLHWSEITASALVELNIDDNSPDQLNAVEPTAYFIHTRLHRGLPDARCVLHTHMPYATTLTVLEKGRLLPISQTACMFYGRVAYYDDYRGLVVDDSEGDRLAAAFADKAILFLANHGVIVTGPDVAHAFNDLYYLERACQLQVQAQSTGDTLRMLPHDVATRTAAQFMADGAQQVPLHFEALRRALDREDATYKD